jgi:hypothetical protein
MRKQFAARKYENIEAYAEICVSLNDERIARLEKSKKILLQKNK